MTFLWDWKEKQIEPKKVEELIRKEADEMNARFVKQFRELTNQTRYIVVDYFKKFAPINNGN
jgi:hypothetical protein